MRAPKHLDFTPKQVEDLIERLNKEALRKEDYPVLTNLLKAIIWMNFSLQEKQLSIQRLRAVFGIKTESAKNLAKFIEEHTAAANALENASDQSCQQTASNPDAVAGEKTPEEKKGKHGHRPSSDYTQDQNHRYCSSSSEDKVAFALLAK